MSLVSWFASSKNKELTQGEVQLNGDMLDLNCWLCAGVNVFLNATSRNVLETSLLLNYIISNLAFIFVANLLVFTENHPLTEE